MGSPVGPTATPAAMQPLAQPVGALVALLAHGLGPALQDPVQLVDRVDLGDDVHGDLVLVPRRVRDVDPAEGVLPHMGRRLAQHVELAGVLHVVQLVQHAVLAQPLRAQLELGGGPPARVGFVELVDVHRRHTTADQDHCRRPAIALRLVGPVGGIGGGAADDSSPAMPTRTSKPRVALIDQMAAEWQSIGRSPSPSASLRDVARRDPGLALLVLGTDDGPPPCPTPCDLVEHMRRASGRVQREEAARLVRVLLREAGADPFICRMLVQALIPGPRHRGREAALGTRRRLAGRRGVLRRAALDDLARAAGMVRPGPPLRRPRPALGHPLPPPTPALPVEGTRRATRRLQAGRGRVDGRPARSETDLEELARMLIDLHREGMRPDEVQVLYAHHVLGYSMAELSALTGRDRRALYARRDRGQRRLCA